jgi:hypothetical protein
VGAPPYYTKGVSMAKIAKSSVPVPPVVDACGSPPPVPYTPLEPSYSTTDTSFAAQLLTDNLLRLTHWTLTPEREVAFHFADPEGRGSELEMRWVTGRDRQFLVNRSYLMDKVRLLRGTRAGGGVRDQKG